MVVGVPALNYEAWRDVVMLDVFSKRCVAELDFICYYAARLFVVIDYTCDYWFGRSNDVQVRAICRVDYCFRCIVHVMRRDRLGVRRTIVGVGVW